MVLAGGIAGVVVGLAGVYGIATLTRNAGGDVVCRPAVELAKKIAPLARGEVAAVDVAKSPLKLPDLAFTDSTGKPLTLADLARPHAAAQPVGHLVRALPHGNADSGRAARQTRRARL